MHSDKLQQQLKKKKDKKLWSFHEEEGAIILAVFPVMCLAPTAYNKQLSSCALREFDLSLR